MFLSSNVIAVATLATLHMSCYMCLLIEEMNKKQPGKIDLTLSNAIDSTPGNCYWFTSIIVLSICCVHCYDKCDGSNTINTIIVFLGLLCILTLKITNYNTDPVTGLLEGVDGLIHYTLASIGVFLLFIYIYLVADCTWKLLATKVNFGCLLIVALIASDHQSKFVPKLVCKHSKQMVALFENLCLFTFALILYYL